MGRKKARQDESETLRGQSPGICAGPDWSQEQDVRLGYKLPFHISFSPLGLGAAKEDI